VITIVELAELVIQMNDGSRALADQVKALEAENAVLKEQLVKVVTPNG
jgi:hypothetical protein